MIRGNISNEPSIACGVDYRVLLHEKRSYSWFQKMIPEILLKSGFEVRMKNALPFKSGAKDWIERNWDVRLIGVCVGVPFLSRTLDMILGQYLSEVKHFDDYFDLRLWLRRTTRVMKMYTIDDNMVGVFDNICLFEGFHKKVIKNGL